MNRGDLVIVINDIERRLAEIAKILLEILGLLKKSRGQCPEMQIYRNLLTSSKGDRMSDEKLPNEQKRLDVQKSFEEIKKIYKSNSDEKLPDV